MIKLKRGLEVPIGGEPRQVIDGGVAARSVGVVGYDYVGMKPAMAVEVGERVRLGQRLFTDKKNPGARYTAPAAGTVAAINRGARRTLQSVVIDVEEGGGGTGPESPLGNHPASGGGAALSADAALSDDRVMNPHAPLSADEVRGLAGDEVRARLAEAGEWTALRTRPFSKVPAPDSTAKAIFITAMDTHPLAPEPAVIIREQEQAFALGQDLLAALIPGPVYVCAAADPRLPLGDAPNIRLEQFAGPHPAGLAGTHIHYLDPVGPGKTVWTIGYQDVIAIGRLFLDGRLYTERVVALAGPSVAKPRLLRTRLGADIEALCAGELIDDASLDAAMGANQHRIISGSVLGGRRAQGAAAYLGRYHNQVTALREGRRREFMGWLSPGINRHSCLPIYLSHLLPRRRLAMTTNTNGSERAMVPVGSYERVMPLDILPTQLLRALIVGDTEMAGQLGCLELDEEDLALCSYVCPGKYEYGPILRDNLSRIEREG